MKKKKEEERVQLPVPEVGDHNNKLVSHLGNFVIEFERLMDNLRATITTIMYKQGLKDNYFAEILMFDSTAKSLTDYFCAVLKRYLPRAIPGPKYKHKDEGLVHDFIESIFLKLKTITELRNGLLHSYWQSIHFVDDSSFIPYRWAVNKNGLKDKFDFRYPTDKSFQKVNDNLRILNHELDELIILLSITKYDQILNGNTPITTAHRLAGIKNLDFDLNPQELEKQTL